jgi:hypothetical protein
LNIAGKALGEEGLKSVCGTLASPHVNLVR